MQSKARISLLGILLLALGGTAEAADLPVLYKAAPAVTPTWTGFYGGFHGGAGVSRKKFLDNFPVPDGEVDADVDVRGWLGGLQAGFNYQINWLVVGLEADFTWSQLRNSFNCFPFGSQVCSAEANWLGDVTGRLGVAMGPLLIFGKGGAVWVHDRFTDLATCAPGQPLSRAGIPAVCGDEFVASDIRTGWLVGGGLEFMFASSWTAKIEFNHIETRGKSVGFSDGLGNFFTEEIHQRIDVVKLGVNYIFPVAGSPTAVSAYAYAPSKVERGKDIYRKAKVAGDTDENSPGGRVLTFAGTDFARYSVEGWLGGLIAVNGDLDVSGPRVMLLGSGGVYKYPVLRQFIHGGTSSGEVLAGWGFEGDDYSANFLLGANAINHTLSEIDPENSVQGTKIGIKVRGDLWHNPTAATLVAGEGEYSSAFDTFFVTGKTGYDVTKWNGKGIFVGPEGAFMGDQRSTQWRVGAHATQMKIGRIQVGLSGGFAHDSVVGDGAYGRIELNTNF